MESKYSYGFCHCQEMGDLLSGNSRSNRHCQCAFEYDYELVRPCRLGKLCCGFYSLCSDFLCHPLRAGKDPRYRILRVRACIEFFCPVACMFPVCGNYPSRRIHSDGHREVSSPGSGREVFNTLHYYPRTIAYETINTITVT